MIIAGVDEVGRGPLAGPVVACAVIFDPMRPKIRGLTDSKLLTAARRETLASRIRERALCWAVGRASVEEIDELNILHAAMLAMTRAVEALTVMPTRVVVDGNRLPRLPCPGEAIVGGDLTVKEISAASILAKVIRDAEMCELDERYPQFGFREHKGYGTPEHLKALAEHGPCEIHRRTFAPVRHHFDLVGA